MKNNNAFSLSPSHPVDSQNEWSREFDRNIKLVSGLVSGGDTFSF